MLDIGPSSFRNAGHVKAVPCLNEGRRICIKDIRLRLSSTAIGIGRPAAVAYLFCWARLRDDDR